MTPTIPLLNTWTLAGDSILEGSGNFMGQA
jgi:hypothetical protein